MDYMLEPPELSAKERWVESKVDEWVDEIERFIGVDVAECQQPIDLYEFINWGDLRRSLYELADELYEDMVSEAQIEAWEQRQESRWEY